METLERQPKSPPHKLEPQSDPELSATDRLRLVDTGAPYLIASSR